MLADTKRVVAKGENLLHMEEEQAARDGLDQLIDVGREEPRRQAQADGGLPRALGQHLRVRGRGWGRYLLVPLNPSAAQWGKVEIPHLLEGYGIRYARKQRFPICSRLRILKITHT